MRTTKYKNRIEPKYIILIIIGIIALLLAIFSYVIKDKRELNKIEQIGKDSITFVTRVISAPFKFVVDQVVELSNLKDVYKENETLKKNLDRYDYIYTQNIELKRQNDELKKTLDIDYTIDEYDYLHASVVSRNVGYWYDTITINKGSNSGIEKDMAVVTSNGLIGKITKVSSFTSDVKLITSNNSNNKISVVIYNNEEHLYGVLTGYDYKTDSLKIEGVATNKEIKKNSVIYTSGLNNMLPSGILVGAVTEVESDSYGLSNIVHAKSSSDVNNLVTVSVLKRKGADTK